MVFIPALLSNVPKEVVIASADVPLNKVMLFILDAVKASIVIDTFVTLSETALAVATLATEV